MNCQMVMKVSCAIAVLALAVTSVGPTAAQPVRVKSGILDCDVSGGWGFIIGSQKTVQCLFTPDQPGPREPYVGVISKFGLDIGGAGRGQMMWGGFFGTPPRRGGLAGDYFRVTREGGAAGGARAHLVGGG